MVDQATSLSDAGIPATYLGSAQSDKTIPQRIKAGEFKVVYVTVYKEDKLAALQYLASCKGISTTYNDKTPAG